MPTTEIDEFGKNLIQQVRDAAIRSCDLSLRPVAKGPGAQRWKQALKDGNAETIAKMLIPDVVDETLAQLCRVIDEEGLRLSYTTSDGKTVNLSEDGLGELVGWYIGSDGWRAWYSKERFIDDFADL